MIFLQISSYDEGNKKYFIKNIAHFYRTIAYLVQEDYIDIVVDFCDNFNKYIDLGILLDLCFFNLFVSSKARKYDKASHIINTIENIMPSIQEDTNLNNLKNKCIEFLGNYYRDIGDSLKAFEYDCCYIRNNPNDMKIAMTAIKIPFDNRFVQNKKILRQFVDILPIEEDLKDQLFDWFTWSAQAGNLTDQKDFDRYEFETNNLRLSMTNPLLNSVIGKVLFYNKALFHSSHKQVHKVIQLINDFQNEAKGYVHQEEKNLNAVTIFKLIYNITQDHLEDIDALIEAVNLSLFTNPPEGLLATLYHRIAELKPENKEYYFRKVSECLDKVSNPKPNESHVLCYLTHLIAIHNLKLDLPYKKYVTLAIKMAHLSGKTEEIQEFENFIKDLKNEKNAETRKVQKDQTQSQDQRLEIYRKDHDQTLETKETQKIESKTDLSQTQEISDTATLISTTSAVLEEASMVDQTINTYHRRIHEYHQKRKYYENLKKQFFQSCEEAFGIHQLINTIDWHYQDKNYSTAQRETRSIHEDLKFFGHIPEEEVQFDTSILKQFYRALDNGLFLPGEKHPPNCVIKFSNKKGKTCYKLVIDQDDRLLASMKLVNSDGGSLLIFNIGKNHPEVKKGEVETVEINCSSSGSHEGLETKAAESEGCMPLTCDNMYDFIY